MTVEYPLTQFSEDQKPLHKSKWIVERVVTGIWFKYDKYEDSCDIKYFQIFEKGEKHIGERVVRNKCADLALNLIENSQTNSKTDLKTDIVGNISERGETH